MHLPSSITPPSPPLHTLSAEGTQHAHAWMNLLSTYTQTETQQIHTQTDRQTDRRTHVPTQGDIPPTSKQMQSRHFEELCMTT